MNPEKIKLAGSVQPLEDDALGRVNGGQGEIGMAFPVSDCPNGLTLYWVMEDMSATPCATCLYAIKEAGIAQGETIVVGCQKAPGS